VYEHGSNYVCSKSVPTAQQPTPSCTFKSGKVILQQPVERAQMQKLLATGKTDLLDKFVSMRTRRAFKAFLAWDKEAGKVNFEFEQRESKYPPRKTAAAKTGAASARGTGAGAVKASKPATKAAAKKAAAKTTAAKTPRKASTAAGKAPSAQLAAVIGAEPVARPEAVKKMWDYIKAHNLQDPQDKRTIVADDKLRAVFGKDRIGMFELAGILGQHLA
jgi:DNA topoisomerase-3